MKTSKKLVVAGLIGLASMCSAVFAGDMSYKKDGVMMKDGKMMVMKSGNTSPMNDTMTMSDGTKIMTDGTVMKSDGTKMMMKDGEGMAMDGEMMKTGMMADDSMKSDTMKSDSMKSDAMNSGMMAGTMMENSVMMKDGKMMVMKDGKWKSMWVSRTMSDGTKVDTKGEVMMKDGTKMMLKEGESVSADGKMMKPGM